MWVVQDQRIPNKRAWQGRGGSKLKLRPPPALAAPAMARQVVATDEDTRVMDGVGPRRHLARPLPLGEGEGGGAARPTSL
jgi:hypothetical protein